MVSKLSSDRKITTCFLLWTRTFRLSEAGGALETFITKNRAENMFFITFQARGCIFTTRRQLRNQNQKKMIFENVRDFFGFLNIFVIFSDFWMLTGSRDRPERNGTFGPKFSNWPFLELRRSYWNLRSILHVAPSHPRWFRMFLELSDDFFENVEKCAIFMPNLTFGI